MKSVRIITIIAATMALVACGNKDEQAQNAEQQTFVSNSNNKNADTRPGNRDWGDVSNLMKVDLPKGMSNRMVEYEAMTIYFNPSRHIPNCVIYELTATEVSQADGPKAERRYNYNFNADPQVSSSPEWWEYKNSDYDRGHMAPAMDMRFGAKPMKECFYMTNICPQNHDLNEGEWRHMEEAIHSWGRSLKQLVIATGPIVGDSRETIGESDITVPAKFYKVVYAPRQKRAIAFVFKNEPTSVNWRRHATTVDEVERLTGFDFFAALPDSLENAVESKANINNWPEHHDQDFK